MKPRSKNLQLPNFKSGDSQSSSNDALLLKYIMAIDSIGSNPKSDPSRFDQEPWRQGSTSKILSAAVKRPSLGWLVMDGKPRHNGHDVATSFLRELRLFRTVAHHVNIVPFLGIVDSVGLLLEQVIGDDLHTRLTSSPAPSRTTRLSWARQIMEGILHIHSFGLSHGDLSFGNVAVESASGIIKLIDFGRSTLSPSNESLFPGTSPFSAPDLLDSRDGILGDAYSFGVVLYFMEIGRAPGSKDRLPSMAKMEDTNLSLFGKLVRLYTKEYFYRPRIERAHWAYVCQWQTTREFIREKDMASRSEL